MVNNVETFCAAAHIALHGGAWWAGIGTPKSTGTKIHSVVGRLRAPGPLRVPLRHAHRPHPGRLRRARHAGGAGRRAVGRVPVGASSSAAASPSRTCRPPAPSWCSTARATCSRWRATSRTSSPTRAAASARPAASAPRWSCGAWTSSPPATARATTWTSCYELDKLMHGATPLRPGRDAPATRCATPSPSSARPTSGACKSLHFEPAFDLDAELSVARPVTGRDDPALTHLAGPTP